MTAEAATTSAGALGPVGRGLVDDLAEEILERDRAFAATLNLTLPPADTILPEAEARALADRLAAGRARLAEHGLDLRMAGDDPASDAPDPLGTVVLAGLVDAARADAGRLDLAPAPRDPRPVETVLAEDYETTVLPSGLRMFVARRPGRPLLVISALGIPVGLWQRLLADAEGPFRPILVETRCGDPITGGMRSPAALTRHAADLAEALRVAGFETVDVLAWCNGGRIAVDLAHRLGDRIGAVALLSTTLRGTAGIDDAPSPFEENLEKIFTRVRAKPDFAGAMTRFLAQLFTPPDWSGFGEDSAGLAAAFLGRPREAHARALGTPMATGEDLLNYAARTQADEAYPLREALAALPHPTLAVTGAQDQVIANDATLSALALVPGARWMTLDGAGHYIQDLQYAYLRAALSAFFADPEGAALDGPARVSATGRSDRGLEACGPEWRYRAGPATPHGARLPLARLFSHAAETRGGADAIADGGVTLSFTDLEARSGALGARLAAVGAAPGRAVAVLAEKRAVMAVAAGGIWKADAVYAPLDAESPAGRLADLFDQLGPAAVIGSRARLDALAEAGIAEGLPTVAFEEILEAGFAEAATDAALPVPSDDEDRPAYVLFTSGSTGTPKGVQISHRALLDYFHNHNRVLRFGPDARVFSLAPFHFDVSIEDTLLPLSLGAFVYQFRGMPVGPLMRKVLERERITHLIAVSSLLALITGDGEAVTPESLPALRMVMTGAEVCDPRLIDLWVERLPGARVINAYGPTEATIVCLTHTIERPEPERTSAYPIGRPLDGVTIRLVDQGDREITEPDRIGELLIGGSQVMIGYLGQAEATARACPVIDGARWYRTGDLCHFDAEGRVVYVQRADDMVKLGGRRIHLGEIRHQALALDGVARAAVGLILAEEQPTIALAVVQRAPGAPTPEDVRAALAARLPAYMMPGVVATTDEARLTASGKTDERLLIRAVEAGVRRHGLADGPLAELAAADGAASAPADPGLPDTAHSDQEPAR